MRKQLDRKVRSAVLDRDGHSCKIAGCDSKDHLNVHHIMPVKLGGADNPDNLITVCDIHHKGLHIEFSAYYPDSDEVLKRMAAYLRSSLSKTRLLLRVDDGYGLLAYLEFLTGSKKFRPGQLEAIRAILSGKDVLFVAPTSIGKSICYILPGLLAEMPSLVILPTISLMKDATENIWKSKIPATYINSSLTKAEKTKRFKFIDNSMYKFISIAPEAYFKSKDIRAKKLISSGKYSYFVVDEAHTIKTYGTSFRKSYKDIGQLRQELGEVQTIALTATASSATQDKILDELNIKRATKIVTGIFRDNIKILRPHLEVEYEGKYAYISSLIALHPKSKILIFVSTVKLGDDLVAQLKKAKINSRFYHSKLDADEKNEIHSRFKGDQLPKLNVVVATSAFGMGVDIQNIRHIIHLGPPLNLTEYVQQIGRAGRDGLQAYAHLLYDAGDEGLLIAMSGYSTEAINTGDFGYTEAEKKQIISDAQLELNIMIEFCKDRSLADPWAYLMDYFGEPVRTFWRRNGLWITNIIFITLAGFLLLAALYIITKMVST